MCFTYQLRLGGAYSLDTHVRLQPPFKIRVMKLTKKPTTPLSSGTEKNSGGARLDVSPPSAMKPKTVVRQGPVRVKQSGVHPRNWFFKINWLVLSENQLSLYPSETQNLRSCILLSDIDKLERTEDLPYGLTLQTKNGRRYLLSFENDSELYGWKDDISMHYLGIGLPYNFVHETHVSFNPSTGVITGLPEGGDEVFFNKFVPSEIEPQQSLVIKVPSSKLEYVWRIRSSAEKIQDILKSVCHNMGLQGADNVLALAGDNTPLVGTVADLQGHRELEIITQATDGTAPLQSPSENKIFVRIKIALDADEVHFATTFLVTPQMKIQDLLQLVCSKVKVEVSPHTLKLADGVEPLAMDRTVADLQGKHQLTLIRRDGPLVEDILLRVNLRISPDETFLCSVPATSQMQIYDVLQRICSKMKFKASEYTLAISGSVEPLAMDLTVANLDGKHQLVLVKRASSHGLGADQFQNIFCCHSADIDL